MPGWCALAANPADHLIYYEEVFIMETWAPYLGVIQIILSIVLTVLVLMQTKGGGLGSFMGGGDTGGSFRTRRGVEATLHRITIAVAVLFFVNTVLSFLAWGQI
jgi:preprotein translocase subunit SecG